MIRTALAYVVLALAGLVTAVVGAAAHRSVPPLGAALCILLMIAATLFARSWKEWWGISVFAGLWVLATGVLALEGPGGSVLLATDALGYTWLIGGSVAIVAVCMVPRSILFGRSDVA